MLLLHVDSDMESYLFVQHLNNRLPGIGTHNWLITKYIFVECVNI